MVKKIHEIDGPVYFRPILLLMIDKPVKNMEEMAISNVT